MSILDRIAPLLADKRRRTPRACLNASVSKELLGRIHLEADKRNMSKSRFVEELLEEAIGFNEIEGEGRG